MENQVIVEHIFLLVIVTLFSVLQNAFFAVKLEREGKSGCATSFDRVSCAVRNCMDAYPTFLAVMWCAGLCVSQAPAAFAGVLYLIVRHKYFVGYMGQTSQSTPGFVFGKRPILFLILMCMVGILNYMMAYFLGRCYKAQLKTVTSLTASLLLIP
ncbi:unnamed protein product [Arctogadus glacialis]|uniref:arachidonate 5-lipoxygenase-activating protein n=1 Tax=Gadus chalcogrammus TaxID=1042646 RepID=UPI0024C4BD0F|nr:arachidonate 5-lipoxygenase-activating protein [Gadus chalcogrammus]